MHLIQPDPLERASLLCGLTEWGTALFSLRPMALQVPEVDSVKDAPVQWTCKCRAFSGVVCTFRKNFCLPRQRSEEHTSELQSLMRISYAVFCLKKKNIKTQQIR